MIFYDINVAISRRLAWTLALVLSTALALPPTLAATEHPDIADKLLTLGTGPAGGAFRPIGESLCDLVNAERGSLHVRCVAVATAGSMFNLHSVMYGRLPLALTQEDLVHTLRQDPAQPAAQALRVVALAHESPIAVMVGAQSGITDLRQLAGKRMNMGNRGSGQFTITHALLAALDLKTEQLAATSYFATSGFEEALCGNQVDVVVEAVAHPSALFTRLLACGGRFIDIPPEVAARMQASNRWLAPMTILAGTYANQPRPVVSLGMRNLLVTHDQVDSETVFRLARMLRQRHAALLREQPLLVSMGRPEQIKPENLPAPLHPGAARAYGLRAIPWWAQ